VRFLLPMWKSRKGMRKKDCGLLNGHPFHCQEI
jgi:hypothetical protein